MEPAITFRPICPEDEDFLRELYASTRQDELAQVPWDEEQKRAFLSMQFTAQHQYYQDQFTAATFDIILLHDHPIGRIYIDRREDEIRLIDIAMLPERRNAGIGTALLKDLLAEAAQVGKPVCIHVEKFNPAMRLYERLGFVPIDDQGVYLLMQWSPNASSSYP
jgi:GNAT superfamily N-acetyltransferase